jgi:hypothetical protein
VMWSQHGRRTSRHGWRYVLVRLFMQAECSVMISALSCLFPSAQSCVQRHMRAACVRVACLYARPFVPAAYATCCIWKISRHNHYHEHAKHSFVCAPTCLSIGCWSGPAVDLLLYLSGPAVTHSFPGPLLCPLGGGPPPPPPRRLLVWLMQWTCCSLSMYNFEFTPLVRLIALPLALLPPPPRRLLVW